MQNILVFSVLKKLLYFNTFQVHRFKFTQINSKMLNFDKQESVFLGNHIVENLYHKYYTCVNSKKIDIP